MSEAHRIEEEDLHAYIDGELDPVRYAQVDAALSHDPALAFRVEQFRADKMRLADMFAPVAKRPLPAAWTTRIEAALAPKPARPTAWLMALAASVLLAVTSGGIALLWHPADTILAEAAAAHDGQVQPDVELAGKALPPEAVRNQLLLASLGMKVRAPDLSRFGYQLTALDVFHHRFAETAAGLVYRTAQGTELTVYVRKSGGTPRFDLLRRGKLRVCVWQDDVVGAVITGDMSAGEMMRIASRAYADLNL
jgi:anti-sigma factor RsiW